MPVILPMESRAAWLDSATDAEKLKSLLVPFDASRMEAYTISPLVGSPKYDDAKLIEKYEPAPLPLRLKKTAVAPESEQGLLF